MPKGHQAHLVLLVCKRSSSAFIGSIGLRRFVDLVTFGKQKSNSTAIPANTHSAVFVEVKVDEDLGTLHVTGAVSAIAAEFSIRRPHAAKFSALSFGGWEWLSKKKVSSTKVTVEL